MVVSPTPNPELAKPITSLARHWITFRYVLGDVLASAMAWTTLYLYRKQELELAPAFLETWFPEAMWMDGNFRYGLMFVPMFWWFLSPSDRNFLKYLDKKHLVKMLLVRLGVKL